MSGQMKKSMSYGSTARHTQEKQKMQTKTNLKAGGYVRSRN